MHRNFRDLPEKIFCVCSSDTIKKNTQGNVVVDIAPTRNSDRVYQNTDRSN